MERKVGHSSAASGLPPAFHREVNSRQTGVVAEYVSLDITRMGEAGEYDVIIDRNLA